MPHREVHHPKENSRLAALQSLQILDTPIEERFERITRLVCKAFDVPICAISCINEHSVWFKSIQGINACAVDRNITFCQHAILGNELFMIKDARHDSRFSDNPLVCQANGLKFYAGMPICSFDGLPIAVLCMMDTEPRTFDENELEMLSDFAKFVQNELHIPGPNTVQDDLIQQVSDTWRRSMIDPLTRLWNHEGIQTTLEESLCRSAASCGGLLVVKLNLRQFGEINSTLGYAAGDQILQEFAKALIREVGEEHICGRIYDDQFAIIMNTVPGLPAAKVHLDAIQQFVDSYPVTGVEDRTTMGCALAGVFVQGGCQMASQEIFENLDDSIYTAKLLDEYQLTVVQSLNNDRRSA